MFTSLHISHRLGDCTNIGVTSSYLHLSIIDHTYTFSNIHALFYAAQECTNRTLAVHERVDSQFLVLPGSESTITEITEYMYFSPLKPCVNLNIKVSKILYQWILLLNPFCFCETIYLHFTIRVFGHNAITPFLGGMQTHTECSLHSLNIIVHTKTLTSREAGRRRRLLQVMQSLYG